MKVVGLYKLHLNQCLGEGTLGKTYVAIHQLTSHVITMRHILKSKYRQVKKIKQILKISIQQLSKIQVQNIASFIDFIQTQHSFYILREYCPDGSLRQLMKKKKKISENQVKQILVQLLKGMVSLIKKGIIHKNICPQNILFCNGLVKISDFGIQKINSEIQNHDQSNELQIKNQLQYKSPQILQGAKGNFKCDIWSLGIILYQLLYGKHPWPSNSVISLKNNIYKSKLQFPHDVEISKQMKKFIMSCLMIDVNERAEWQQIYESNFLEDSHLPKFSNLDQKYVFLLTLIQKNILKSKLSMQKYLQSENIQLRDKLNRKAFSFLVNKIAPTISQEQIEFLYIKLDKDANQQLQLKQFQQAIKEMEIYIDGSYHRRAEKLLKAKDIDIELQQEEKKQKDLDFIYKGLIQNLEKKQITDWYELFTQADKRRIGILQFNQFIQLLRMIDSTLTKTQCEKIFKDFDRNDDKQISFNQFNRNMSRVVESYSYLINLSD